MMGLLGAAIARGKQFTKLYLLVWNDLNIFFENPKSITRNLYLVTIRPKAVRIVYESMLLKQGNGRLAKPRCEDNASESKMSLSRTNFGSNRVENNSIKFYKANQLIAVLWEILTCIFQFSASPRQDKMQSSSYFIRVEKFLKFSLWIINPHVLIEGRTQAFDPEWIFSQKI